MPELQENESSLNINEILSNALRFVKKRRWYILAPFFLVTLVSSGALAILPNQYTSIATLVVVQQQVPQRYVVPNSTTDVSSALQAIKQEVLSRTQLLQMIYNFGLYQKQRKRLAPEQLVELMNKNIELEVINETPQQVSKDFDAFRISFTAESAVLAQQVTTNLTSLFTNEYTRTQTEQATNTSSFLHEQVQEKGKELEQQETRLKDFKLQHVGELPEQQQGNLGIFQALQAQLNNTMSSLDHAHQQRALLQAQFDATPRRVVQDSSGQFVATPAGGGAPAAPSPIQAAQSELSRLEAARSELLSHGYTEQFPDIQRNQRDIDRAKDKIARLKAEAPPVEPPAPVRRSSGSSAPAIAVGEDPVVVQLKGNLEANRVEIDNLSKEQARLKAEIAEYQQRINQTPVREQQQAGIVRDTEALRAQYSELQKKEQESQLATNLEKRQGGQQFRLVDAASLPALPSRPKRAKLSLAAAGGGLALGFALAFFMQLKDTSYYTEKELTKDLTPPFVLGIPMLQTPKEVRERKSANLLQWIAVSAMMLVVCAAELYVYKLG
ncbi:MAG TPA: hypothetical protein VHW45_05000 [Candidatus Sulfotelmatobacter sp.]|nr:hypothetical protein [Candidatus Sulfotelmatobacter sp.]